MKKLLRSTIGTLVVAAFLAIASPMYARGGHGGGHGGHGGHAARGHAAAGQVRGGHAGFHARGGGGQSLGAGRTRTRAVCRTRIQLEWWPSLGRQLLVSILWIFSARLLRLRLWLSILREWLLRLPLRWVLSVLRKLGILPLPLRILAVRELQLRVLRSIHHSRNSGRSNAARLLISTSLTSRAARNDCAITELLKTEFLRVLTHNTALQVVPDYRLLGGMLISDYAKNDRTERTIHAIHFL